MAMQIGMDQDGDWRIQVYIWRTREGEREMISNSLVCSHSLVSWNFLLNDQHRNKCCRIDTDPVLISYTHVHGNKIQP